MLSINTLILTRVFSPKLMSELNQVLRCFRRCRERTTFVGAIFSINDSDYYIQGWQDTHKHLTEVQYRRISMGRMATNYIDRILNEPNGVGCFVFGSSKGSYGMNKPDVCYMIFPYMHKST